MGGGGLVETTAETCWGRSPLLRKELFITAATLTPTSRGRCLPLTPLHPVQTKNFHAVPQGRECFNNAQNYLWKIPNVSLFPPLRPWGLESE